jgi:hypothetical protein
MALDSHAAIEGLQPFSTCISHTPTQYVSVQPQRLEVAGYKSRVCLRRLQTVQPVEAGFVSVAAVSNRH